MPTIAHDSKGPISATAHEGIYYFPSFDAARDYARLLNLPVDRIIYYQRGWAIQKHVSGPYAGPKGWS